MACIMCWTTSLSSCTKMIKAKCAGFMTLVFKSNYFCPDPVWKPVILATHATLLNLPEWCTRLHPMSVASKSRTSKKVRVAHLELFTLLDVCVSSLRRGHANILCIVPILTDDPRRESSSHTQNHALASPKGSETSLTLGSRSSCVCIHSPASSREASRRSSGKFKHIISVSEKGCPVMFFQQ